MLGDNERSGAYASEQKRLVRAAVAAEVLVFTPYWREAAAEVDLRRPTTAADLAALAPRPLTELRPPDTLVLRPSTEAVRKSGPRPLRRRLRRARLGRGAALAGRRILDPLYKPVHWIIEGETPVGCTEADLVRLAEIGSRSLELAGITANDAIVGLVQPGPTLSTWQLALGAREAGVPLAGLAPSTSLEAVAMLGPTVLAGRPPDLLRVLNGLDPTVRSSILTVLAVTRLPLRTEARDDLRVAAGGQASVVEMWSPPGVRALWAQCRDGEGVHTWPQAELLEVCGPDGTAVAPGDEGELVWTGLGWRGTVMVRLATGMRGRLVEGRCDSCGRTTPRVVDAYPVDGLSAERSERDEPQPARMRRTGGDEAARTVRTPRRPRKDRKETGPAPGAAVEDVEASAAFAPPAAAPAPEQPDPAPAVRAVARAEPDPAGSVRAVPRDDLDGDAASATRPDRVLSEIGEVSDLPPVPGVGPDAGGEGPVDARVDPWLPDTGEIDAWPAPVLASVDGLAAWQVEHRRRRGHDELVVHLALAEGAELGDVLVSLERSIGATQYVVGQEVDIAARVAAAGGRRVVDRRSRRRAAGNGSTRRAVPAARTLRDG